MPSAERLDRGCYPLAAFHVLQCPTAVFGCQERRCNIRRSLRQAQDAVARFLAPHLPVASPLAAQDGSYVCLESLPVGEIGTCMMHAVRMSRFLPGCTLDKATQVSGALLSCKIRAPLMSTIGELYSHKPSPKLRLLCSAVVQKLKIRQYTQLVRSSPCKPGARSVAEKLAAVMASNANCSRQSTVLAVLSEYIRLM